LWKTFILSSYHHYPASKVGVKPWKPGIFLPDHSQAAGLHDRLVRSQAPQISLRRAKLGQKR